MALDTKGFMREKLVPRTKVVEVPELAAWTDSGNAPTFTVCGLTGEQLARVKTAVESNRNTGALVEALVGKKGREAAGAIKNILGTGDDLPDDYVKRIEILLQGTVEPDIDRQFAVRLAVTFPLVVHQLTDHILMLTGLGHEPGKSKGSGTTQQSATL